MPFDADSLIAHGKPLPSWVQEYFDWVYCIPALREERTVKEFCEKRSISNDRLYRLENSTYWLDMVKERTLRGGFTAHQIASVKQAALNAALDPKGSRDRELILRMSGDYVPVAEQKVTNPQADVKSATSQDLMEELAKRAVAAAERMNGIPAAPTTTKE